MDDEILLKVALDLDKASKDFQDFTGLWEKHNGEINKGKAQMQKYADDTAKAYESVNRKVKEKITQVGNEGKAVDALSKKFEALDKKNAQAFESEDLEKFNQTLAKVSGSIGNLDNFNFSTADLEDLSKKLASVDDDFEALNVLVDFFEKNMKTAANSVVDDFDVIKKKIDETKINIRETESFIKQIDRRISSTAPGVDQSNLIRERNAAQAALTEEKVALADYTAQLKQSREESVSLQTQLRRVKDELVQLELAGGRGSERWQELTDEAEKYNTAIATTNAEINRSTKATAGLDNIIGAATGLVGLFTAAEGAASLFGDQSEDLQKSLVRLTGAIALLNGLQQVQTELSKRETIAGRALTAVKAQYAIATDASAKATVRLAAATKLLGIGLLVGALAAIVVYWKDISKWIGLTSESTERLNKINKSAIAGASAEIGRLKGLQLELTNVNTPLSRQREIRKDLLEQYPNYLKVLGDEKTSVNEINDAFNNLNNALLLNAKLKAAQDLISEEFTKVLEAERKALAGEATTFQGVLNDFKNSILFAGAPAGVASSFTAADNIRDAGKNLEEAKKDFSSFETFIQKIIGDINTDLANLGGDPTKDGERLKDLQKQYEQFASVLENLIKKQENTRIALLESSREREIEILNQRVEEEKNAYAKQINDLKISENAKAKLRAEFNKLYNDENGLAYEELRKNIAEIDRKYDEELEEVRFRALSAIGEVYETSEQLEREAIAKKWDGIRKELEEQIKNTDDFLKKQELQNIIDFSFQAQDQEETEFDTNTSLDRIDREKEIADSILKIYQANARDIIQNEEVKQLQLLSLEKGYLEASLGAYRDGLKTLEDQNIFDGLIDTLQNSVDPAEIEDAANKLREGFGDKTANEILKTVSALREVANGIADIGEKSNFEKLIDDFQAWTQSLESFSLKLAESLGLQGDAAKEFASGVAVALRSTFDSLSTIFEAEVEEHRAKVDSFQESIDQIESELERERQLYEDGYANNFEQRQLDLENLREQKAKEEEELQKAQKRKAALAKAELLIDTVSQIGSLITASANIFKWASKIPFIGVPLAIGLITTMFGAFAIAKTKAFQAIGQGQNFRKGLQEGRLELQGPKHEDKGFGLYNSKTGERIAEFEDGEDVLVLNPAQKKKYRRVIDALIADAQGRGDIDSTLEGYYAPKQIGETTYRVIKHVNEVTIKAHKSKQDAYDEESNLTKEFKSLTDSFEKEFSGYRKERANKIETWQTDTHFFVKKGNVTKKFKKS